VRYRRKNGSIAPDAQDAISPVKRRKPQKIDGAGVSFLFGANAPKQDSPLRRVEDKAPPGVAHPLRWEELGDGAEQSQPRFTRRK